MPNKKLWIFVSATKPSIKRVLYTVDLPGKCEPSKIVSFLLDATLTKFNISRTLVHIKHVLNHSGGYKLCYHELIHHNELLLNSLNTSMVNNI